MAHNGRLTGRMGWAATNRPFPMDESTRSRSNHRVHPGEEFVALDTGPQHLPELSVSFALTAGQSLQLSGPSGSGKTSLLRVLARLEPGRGKVSFGSPCPVPVWRTRVQYIPAQSPGGGSTVSSWLERPLRFEAAKSVFEPSRCQELIEALGLAELDMQAPLERCSAGEQQRLRIARSLAFRPQVLLADEPFSHLDEALRNSVKAVFQSFVSIGGLLVIVSHQDPFPGAKQLHLHDAPAKGRSR